MELIETSPMWAYYEQQIKLAEYFQVFQTPFPKTHIYIYIYIYIDSIEKICELQYIDTKCFIKVKVDLHSSVAQSQLNNN